MSLTMSMLYYALSTKSYIFGNIGSNCLQKHCLLLFLLHVWFLYRLIALNWILCFMNSLYNMLYSMWITQSGCKYTGFVKPLQKYILFRFPGVTEFKYQGEMVCCSTLYTLYKGYDYK